MNSPDLMSKLAIDSKSIDDLHLLSKQDSRKALHEAAKQFEALFLQILVKSMRDATLKSGLIDSHQTRFYTEMYDQQLAQSLSVKGVGLADMMVKQLTQTYSHLEQSESPDNQYETNVIPLRPNAQSDNRQTIRATNNADLFESNYYTGSRSLAEMETKNPSAPNADKSALLWPSHPSISKVTEKVSPDYSSISNTSNNSVDFINTLMPHARNAAAVTGIPPHFMLAQAALESGWGRYEIRHPDNSPSHNLFGIKADGNWKGKTIETMTTEYVNGVPQKIIEKFRAYGSYEEGFRDYINFLSDNPRYAEVLNAQNASDFAHGLQRAGYATDPQYANKLIRILNQSVLDNQGTI